MKRYVRLCFNKGMRGGVNYLTRYIKLDTVELAFYKFTVTSYFYFAPRFDSDRTPHGKAYTSRRRTDATYLTSNFDDILEHPSKSSAASASALNKSKYSNFSPVSSYYKPLLRTFKKSDEISTNVSKSLFVSSLFSQYFFSINFLITLFKFILICNVTKK